MSAIQIGITFVGALAAAVGGAGAEETITPGFVDTLGVNASIAEVLAMLMIVVQMTYVSVVFDELVPKTFALRRPLFLVFRTGPWLHGIGRIIDPVVKVLEWFTKKVVNLFPAKHLIHENLEHQETAIELDGLSVTNRQYVLNI